MGRVDMKNSKLFSSLYEQSLEAIIPFTNFSHFLLSISITISFSASDSPAVHCARAQQLLNEHEQQRRRGVQHVGALSRLLQGGSSVNCHCATQSAAVERLRPEQPLHRTPPPASLYPALAVPPELLWMRSVWRREVVKQRCECEVKREKRWNYAYKILIPSPQL